MLHGKRSEPFESAFEALTSSTVGHSQTDGFSLILALLHRHACESRRNGTAASMLRNDAKRLTLKQKSDNITNPEPPVERHDL